MHDLTLWITKKHWYVEDRKVVGACERSSYAVKSPNTLGWGVGGGI